MTYASTELLLAVTSGEANAPGGPPGWLLLSIVVCVFVIPFVIGSFVSKALKLKDLSFKMSIVLLTLALAATPFIYHFAAGKYEQTKYQSDLKAWEEKGKKFERVTDEGVEKLQTALPGATIKRSFFEN
jgi:hypothetical protein